MKISIANASDVENFVEVSNNLNDSWVLLNDIILYIDVKFSIFDAFNVNVVLFDVFCYVKNMNYCSICR